MLTLSYPFAIARLYRSLRVFAVLNISAMVVGIFFEALAIDLVQVRIAIFSFVTLVLIVYPSLRVLRTKDGYLLRSLLGALFLFMVAATVVRIIDAIHIGPALVLFGPSLGESLTLVFFYVYLILGGAGDSDFVGRLSGDEFMVFLSAVDSRRIDEEMARLRSAAIVDPPDGIPYTVSSEAATFDFPAGRGISFSRVYADCSLALRRAKEKGPAGGFVAPA